MLKKNKILLILLVAITVVCALVSCENTAGAEVTKDVFCQALDISNQNVTVKMYQEYNGHTENGVLKFVNGKGYLKSDTDTLWYDETDHIVKMLSSLVDDFDSFTFTEDKYFSESAMMAVGSDDDIAVKNVYVKINSDGRLISIDFSVPQEDGDVIFSMDFSNYGKTKAPSRDQIYSPGNNNNSSSGNLSDLVNKQYKVDFFYDGDGCAVDEKQWASAFSSLTKSYYAEMKMTTSDGVENRQYLVGNEKSFCSVNGSNSWSVGSNTEFTQYLSFLSELYNECDFVGGKYVCSDTSVVLDNNGRIVDLSIIFNEEAKIAALSYALEYNGKRGEIAIQISTYDKVELPSTILNSGTVNGGFVSGGDFVVGGNGSTGDFGYIVGGNGSTGDLTLGGEGSFGTFVPGEGSVVIQFAVIVGIEIVDPDGNVIGGRGSDSQENNNLIEDYFSPLFPKKEVSKEDKNEKE